MSNITKTLESIDGAMSSISSHVEISGAIGMKASRIWLFFSAIIGSVFVIKMMFKIIFGVLSWSTSYMVNRGGSARRKIERDSEGYTREECPPMRTYSAPIRHDGYLYGRGTGDDMLMILHDLQAELNTIENNFNHKLDVESKARLLLLGNRFCKLLDHRVEKDMRITQVCGSLRSSMQEVCTLLHNDKFDEGGIGRVRSLMSRASVSVDGPI